LAGRASEEDGGHGQHSSEGQRHSQQPRPAAQLSAVGGLLFGPAALCLDQLTGRVRFPLPSRFFVGVPMIACRAGSR